MLDRGSQQPPGEAPTPSASPPPARISSTQPSTPTPPHGFSLGATSAAGPRTGRQVQGPRGEWSSPGGDTPFEEAGNETLLYHKLLHGQLLIDVARRLGSEDVLERLAELFVQRGTPEFIRSDNGAEFTAIADES